MRRVLVTPILLSLIASVFIGSPLWAGDTITLKGDKQFKGLFEGYANSRFRFSPSGDKIVTEPLSNVESLALDRPANAKVKQKGKKAESSLLKAYATPEFIFLQNDKEVKIPAAQITSIEMSVDFGRIINADKNAADSGEVINIEDLLEKDQITIIHFRVKNDKTAPTLRMEDYASTLEKEGKVKVRRIDIDDYNTAMARKYGITSSPQLWFYDKAGKLKSKLVDRFGETEIANALKAAR